MGLLPCQQDITESQQHHHEGIDKEPAISQHENVTENYGSHPDNNQLENAGAAFAVIGHAYCGGTPLRRRGIGRYSTVG